MYTFAFLVKFELLHLNGIIEQGIIVAFLAVSINSEIALFHVVPRRVPPAHVSIGSQGFVERLQLIKLNGQFSLAHPVDASPNVGFMFDHLAALFFDVGLLQLLEIGLLGSWRHIP